MAFALARVLVVVFCALAGVTLAPRLALSELTGGVAGAVVGAFAIGVERAATAVPAHALLWAVAGGGVGLVAGVAVAEAVRPFAGGAAGLVRAVGIVLGVYVGAMVALRRSAELPALTVSRARAAGPAGLDKIVDTSVIIDGRIADICEAGFVEGTLVVPRFVLRELQRVADSADPLRRARGKRGFDVLQRLQAMPGVRVEVLDTDFPDVPDVDHKLLALARARGGRVLTNDYNLNKVAAVSGVPVLNINELANAIKPVLLAGDTLTVPVVREGKEPGQGVGFLDDGTMVVVEQGKKAIGQSIEVTVTSTLQTAAGRMIFARPRGDETAGRDA